MPKCRVSSYDNGELPRPPYRERGSFDTADQALMGAHEIIDPSLASMDKSRRGVQALYMQCMVCEPTMRERLA
jgi:hypothetical protein